MKITKMTLEDIYLDWLNNFLTIPAFANYYGISEENAQSLIDTCRNIFRNI